MNRKNKNLAELKASARRMGLAAHKQTHAQGSSFRICQIGNARPLYECGTLDGAFRCLSSEQDKRAAREADFQARMDRCLAS